MASISANPNTLTPSTNGNVVILTGVGTNWTPGTPGSPAFSFSSTGANASLTAQTINTATQATLTINAGNAGTITIMDMTSSSTTNITVATPTATAFTLTAPNPAGAVVGKASGNFTIGLNGNYVGTITPSDGGTGGSFSPASLSWATASDSKTFTYTASTVGNRAISATANPALAAPASVAFAAVAPVSSHKDLYGGL